MEEIAQQLREELQEIIDRYKTRLSVPRIMHIAQDVLHKTLSIKYHPELHSNDNPQDLPDNRISVQKAVEIIEGLMRFCRCFAQHHTEDIRYKDAEQFLQELK